MKLIEFIKRSQSLSYVLYWVKDLLFSPKVNLAHYSVDEYWDSRIQDVLSCPDLEKIPKIPDAGEVKEGYQIMHNGIKIFLGSYYGYGNALAGMHQMLKLSKGVHEPQEEFAFQEIIKKMPEGAIMLELGSYWSFYSMWFNKAVTRAKNYMIEPDARCLYSGKRNFRINKLKGSFSQFFIGEKSGNGFITVDDFLDRENISKLNILHADIQGYELEMLMGVRRGLVNKRIDYLFISTHSNDLHSKCIDFLNDIGYSIICEANLDEAYSYDGVIVASWMTSLSIEISKKTV